MPPTYAEGRSLQVELVEMTTGMMTVSDIASTPIK